MKNANPNTTSSNAMQDDCLRDRVLLITGAAGTLGQVAARTCAQHGATLILLDKTIAGLEELYDTLAETGAPEPALYPLDLAGASEADYQNLARILEQEYGALHGLLHNAAQMDIPGPLASLNPSAWDQVMAVNLHGPYLLTRALLPLMQQTGAASIVFTSDSAARQARAYGGAYSVSKIAIEGFARLLADELESAQCIRVNTLIPGPVQSPLHTRAYPGQNRHRLPTPETLATLYLYLFSPASLGVTGQQFSPHRDGYNS